MNNNDILRRLRFAFDFSNKTAAELFSKDPSSAMKMSQADFLNRLAKDEDSEFIACSDAELASFLDGLIVLKRGLREPTPAFKAKPESYRLSRNDILKKLRIAMSFQEKEMLSTLEQGGTIMSKSELGALFRNTSHKNYKACGNQVLRNFIKGITLQLRDELADSKT